MPQPTGKKPQSTYNEPQKIEEAIRTRAYELYEERGRDGGHDVDDWLRAEQEVNQSKTRTPAA